MVRGLEEKLHEEQLRSPGLFILEDTEGRPHYSQLPHNGERWQWYKADLLGYKDEIFYSEGVETLKLLLRLVMDAPSLEVSKVSFHTLI